MTPKRSHGSKRGSTGPTTGTCRVCGLHVRHDDQAWFHVDDVTGEAWVEHLACHERLLEGAHLLIAAAKKLLEVNDGNWSRAWREANDLAAAVYLLEHGREDASDDRSATPTDS